MSTYLSNSQTYLPSIQPFQPDLQLYAGTLEMKQTKFDQAAKQISSLYGSLLNAPMLRDKNINTRDEFFKSIDYEIKKIANLDLSLQENVNQATQLFTSLYDDKNIVKDMMWTKNFYNQKQRGESFRNCFDPEKCGGEFWQGGLDVLDYRAQEFKAASDDDAMSFGDVRYVPFINVMAEAQKVAEKNGLGDGITVETPLGNGYIVQTTNGPELAAGPLASIFTERFKNDPKIQDYYRAAAYLERKNWVSANAQNYGGDPNAAEQAYIAQKKQAIEELYRPEKDKTEFAKDIQSKKKKELEDKIRQEGTTGSDDLAAEYLKTLEAEKRLTDADGVIGEALTASENSTKLPTRSQAGEAIDGSWAAALFNIDIQKAAIAESWKNYKQLYRSDDVWLAKQKMANDWAIAQWTATQKKKEEEEEENDNFWSTSGISIGDGGSAGPGATVIDLSPDAPGKQLEKETSEAEEEFEGVNRNINTRLFKATFSSAAYGDAQSSSDLVNQVDLLFNEFANWSGRKGTAAERTDASNKLASWNSKSMKEKLNWAKAGGYEYIFKKLDENSQHKMYKNLYGPLANSAINNKESRPYINQTVKSLYPDLQQASNAMVVKNSFQDIQQSLFTGAINKLTATGDNSPLKQFLPYTVGKKGYRSANQFALAYSFDKAGVRTITPYGEGGAPELPAWMQVVVNPMGVSSKNMQRKTVEYEVVGRDGKTRKEKRYADNGQLVTPTATSYASSMLYATGNELLKNQPKIKYTDASGKIKSAYAGEFFTDEYDIAPKYAQYANNFEFEKKSNGERTAFEQNFRDAKWAWAFGDKSDAWIKNDDGTYSPDPYAERTTWFGRRIKGFATLSPVIQFESLVTGGGLASSREIYSEKSGEYFDRFTNYNVDIDHYYGNDYDSPTKPVLHYEIDSQIGAVEVPGGSIFGDLVNMGSFASKSINGVFDISTKDAMSNKYNIGFWQYINASKAGGIGNDAGQSMIMAGNVQQKAIHNPVDAQIFQDLITLSTQRASKEKTKLALNYTYTNLALGKEDWQGLVVRPALQNESDPAVGIITQVVASHLNKKTDSQEVKDYVDKIVTQGITLYQPDAIAEKYNPSTKTESQLGATGGHYFYNTTKRRALEKVMAITGQIQVPGYEDIGDLRIIREGVNYRVVGKIQTGFDLQTGKKKMWDAEAGAPIIFDANTPLNEIVYQMPIPGSNGRIYAGINGFLASARQDLIASGTYQPTERVYDPSFVPDLWMQKFGDIKQIPAPTKAQKAGEMYSHDRLDNSLGDPRVF